MSDHSLAKRRGQRAAFALAAFAVLLAPGCDSITDPIDRIATPSRATFAAGPAASTPFIMVSAGHGRTCALRASGVIECWGNNDYLAAPAEWVTPAGFAHLGRSSSTDNMCAVDNDGVVRCRGNTLYGFFPQVRTAMEGAFTEVSTGAFSACALRTDGVVECWGSDYWGQSPPTVDADPEEFVQVAVGEYHGCALRSGGTITCWGSNVEGESPTLRVASTGRYVQVTAGNWYSCGLRTDGAVECWGWNSYGNAPALRTAADGVFTSVEAAWSHTCAVRDDGAVECWGQNGVGKAPPLSQPATGTYTAVSASAGHTCAVRSDGVTRCWGSNYSGQLYPRPADPVAFAAAPVPGSIPLTWQNVWDDQSFFRIQRRTWDAAASVWGMWEAPDSLAGGTSEWTDTNVSVGTRYSYRLYSCNPSPTGSAPLPFPGWCSDRVSSGAVTAVAPPVPAAPTGFEVTNAPPGSVDLSWSAADDAAARFRIQRRDLLAGVWGPWTAMAAVQASQTVWSDSGVLPGIYQYRIRACSPAGCSAYVVSGRVTTGLPPAAPTSLTATVADAQVDLAWVDMSGDETVFQLQRRDWNAAGSVWGPWTGLAVSPANTPAYSDATVAASGMYRYRVRACSAWGCSDWVPAPGSVTVPAG